MQTLTVSRINQSDLIELWKLNQQMDGLKKVIKDKGDALLKEMANGAATEPGRFVLSRDVTGGVKKPKWKEEYKAMCERLHCDFEILEKGIIADTAASKTGFKLKLKDTK